MSEFRLRGGINLAKFGIGPRPGVPGCSFWYSHLTIIVVLQSVVGIYIWNICLTYKPKITDAVDAVAFGFKGLYNGWSKNIGRVTYVYTPQM